MKIQFAEYVHSKASCLYNCKRICFFISLPPSQTKNYEDI